MSQLKIASLLALGRQPPRLTAKGHRAAIYLLTLKLKKTCGYRELSTKKKRRRMDSITHFQLGFAGALQPNFRR